MENVIKNNNFWFPRKLYKIRKQSWGKIVLLQKIYKFPSNHFLIGRIVFVLIVKNVVINEEFHFPPNLCRIKKKILETKLFV